jgi:hypothetical protein
MVDSKVEFAEHPFYTERAPDWKIYADLREGKHKVLTGREYLWPHEFELAVEHQEGRPPSAEVTAGAKVLRATRENRSRYTNRLKPVIRRMTAICFSRPINTDPVAELFEEGQLEDVDGEGTSLQDFIKKAADEYFLNGYLYGLVDAAPISARNKLEEQTLGLRPYMSICPTLQVKDWDRETAEPARRGRYNWLRTEYGVVEPRISALAAAKESDMCRVLIRKESRYVIHIYEKVSGTWSFVKEIVPKPPIDEIPVAAITDESWIKDVIPLCLLRHNTQSSLDNGLMFQAHQRIIAAGNFKPGEGIVMSEGVVTLMPEGTTVTIVEPSSPQALRDRLSQIDSEIVQTAFLKDRIIPTDSRQMQAVEGQEAEETEFIAEMRRANKRIENWTNHMLEHWAKFQGQELKNPIVFDARIQKESIQEAISYLRSLFDIMEPYPTWKKAEVKKLVTARELAEEEDILAEVDAGGVEPKEPDRAEVLRAALNGQR